MPLPGGFVPGKENPTTRHAAPPKAETFHLRISGLIKVYTRHPQSSRGPSPVVARPIVENSCQKLRPRACVLLVQYATMGILGQGKAGGCDADARMGTG